jgi:nucleoside-diphosphate-sugar epimerase
MRKKRKWFVLVVQACFWFLRNLCKNTTFFLYFWASIKKQNKMILVTGGTGLVGAHLLWHLLQQNKRIIAIRRATSNCDALRRVFSFYTPDPDEFLIRIEWITADVLELGSLSEAFKNVLEVYHCAAAVSIGKGGSEMTDINVVGTRNVVEAAITGGVTKFCFVSSIAACGRATANSQIDENYVWIDNSNRSVYSRSKYYAEHEVWKGIERGLNAVIVNPGVILGVSPHGEGSAQLFALVQNGLQFYTNGGTGYVDVQDVVQVMIQLMVKNVSSERFILVSENCRNKDVLNWIADGFDKPRPFIPIGKNLFLIVGLVAQVLSRFFGYASPINTSMARTATHRDYYSSSKITTVLNYTFKPVQHTISEICTFSSYE